MANQPSEHRSLLADARLHGLRITAQRRLLFELIQGAQEHLDAAGLLRLAQQRLPSIHRATVYRTLDLLKRHRLIDELDLMHLNGEKHYYEAKTGSDHFHLACLICGRIEESTSPLFEQLKEEIVRQGFDVEVARLEIGGRCPACRARAVGPEGGEKPSPCP